MPDVPPIDSQTTFYDKHWANHEYAGRLKLRRAAIILTELAALNLPTPTFVELGCGTGWLTSILGQFGPAVGYELSPATVAESSGRYPSVQFAAVDISRDVPMDRTYSVAVSHEVIEHVEDQPKHMRLAFDLLQPGGYLILTTPNAKTFDAMPKQQRETWSTQPIEDWIDLAETKRLAEAAGFQVVRLETILPGWGRGPVRSVLNHDRVVGLARRLGLARPYTWLRNRAGLGLHLLLVARRPV